MKFTELLFHRFVFFTDFFRLFILWTGNLDDICFILEVLALFLLKMGEAKRRKDLGLPPREKKTNKDEKKAGFISKLSAKYPFLPFILGGGLLTLLIVDLLNYYK